MFCLRYSDIFFLTLGFLIINSSRLLYVVFFNNIPLSSVLPHALGRSLSQIFVLAAVVIIGFLLKRKQGK